jgi:hypothetical protein
MSDDRLSHQAVYNDKHKAEREIEKIIEDLMLARWGMYMFKGADIEVFHNMNEQGKPEIQVRLRLEVR